MQSYTKGSFQFNNKQWLVQKVEYKLRNAKLLDFFGEANGKDDLLLELDKFMKDEIRIMRQK